MPLPSSFNRIFKNPFKVFNTRYGRKLLFSFALPWMAIVIFNMLYIPARQKSSILQHSYEHVKMLDEMVAFSVGEGLSGGNFDLLQESFNWLKSDTNNAYIAIMDERDNPIFILDSLKKHLPVKALIQKPGIVSDNDGLTAVSLIVKNNQKLGSVILVYSLAAANAEIAHELIVFFLVTLFMFASGFWGVVLLAGQAKRLSEEVEVRKLSERAMQISERRFHSLVDNVFEGVFQSTSGGKFITVNPALVKMLGYQSEEELLAVDIGSQLYADQGERDKWAKAMEEKGELRNVELKLRRKDGAFITALENSRFIQETGSSASYYEGTITDITERKKNERELTLLGQTVMSSKDCIVITDVFANIVFVNSSFTETYGYESEEVYGKSIAMLYSDNAAIKAHCEDRADSWYGEVMGRRKNGSEFPVEL